MKNIHSIDQVDRKILESLESDSSKNVAEMSKALGVAPATIYLRIKKLEKKNIIQGYRAILNKEALGKIITSVIEIKLDVRIDADKILAQSSGIRGIISAYAIAGDADAIFVVVANDVQELEKIILKLRQLDGVLSTKSLLVLNTLRENAPILS